MKTIYTTLVLLFSLLAAQGQELRFHLDGGTSSPFGNFTELNPYTSTVISINGGTSFFLSEKLGVGLDLGTFNNPIKNELTEYANSLAFPTVLKGASNQWRTIYATLGPILKLGKDQLSVEISPQIGFAGYKVPEYSVTYFSEILNRDLIIQQQEGSGNVSSVFTSLSAKLGYQISDSFGVYFKAGVQTNELFSKSNMQQSRYKNLTDMDGDGTISEEEIITSPNQEDMFCSTINTFQTNIGVSYSIPLSNKPIDKDLESENNDSTQCHPSILKEPYNGETYFAESGTIPNFTWINHTDRRARSFVFELYQNEVKLFEKKVRSNSYKLSKRVTTDLYKIKASKEYQWRVRTEYDNCESTITGFSNFTISPSQNVNRVEGECNIEFTNIDINCDTPAFTSSGQVRYTGTFTVKNNSATPGILVPNTNFATSQIFDVDVLGATLTYSQSNTMGSACFQTPLILIPGQGAALPAGRQSTYCFELLVPIGTASINFIGGLKTKPGTIDQSVCNTSENVILDNCICDTCDEWQIIQSNENLWKFDYNCGKSNMRMRSEFQILNADPIQRVKAEIVSVQHTINDTLCYTCTKDENTMGLFYKESISGIIRSRNGWQNSGDGDLLDNNNDSYGNQFSWKALTTQGVDFNTKKMFLMNINLPPISTLDCCETKYKVCVRYTFEDINCQSCDYLVCYEYDSSAVSSGGGIGNGGVGTGLGNQSGGNVIPSQLTPKN